MVEQLVGVEKEADGHSLDELSRLCHMAAASLRQVGAQSYPGHERAVLEHLDRLLDFASRCAGAVAHGQDTATLVPPPGLTLADADEERHFAETVSMFLSHAIGSIAELEEEVLAVEASVKPDETIAGIRRVVHTMKAEFGVLNMVAAQKLCHQAETTIDACTENGAPFPVDTMLQCIDALKQFLESCTRDVHAEMGNVAPLLQKLGEVAAAAAAKDGNADAGSAPRVVLTVGGEFADSLPEFITEARSHLSDAEAAMVALSSEPDNDENVNLTFRAFHTIKGVAGFLNLTPLVELAHVSETLLDAARSHRITFTPEDIDLVLAAGDMIQQMIASLEGKPGPSLQEWKALFGKLQVASGPRNQPVAPVVAPVTVPAPSAAAPAGSAPAKDPRAEEASPRAEAEAPKPEAAARANSAGKPAAEHAEASEHKAARVERTIKVSTTRLDMLVDMVGELVIAQSMVLQDPAIQRLDSQSLTRNIGQVGKITRDLQEAAMSLRMVTVKATFQKMARLVRDVAAKAGKKVALSISGEDTELDRNVVEQISDPLVHMIRNAIDHGIEQPEDRRKNGKDPEGHLSLSAYHQGGSIVIEIRDDGRGLDKARIVAKAVEKELLAADVTPQHLSDAEAFNLIFLPGFSTAEKVTDLSGRGVGMDVVRRNIEALRGKIEIDSVAGKGTIFRMRLPLTLAIIDGMVVRVGSNRYVVPTLSIEQSFRPSADDVHLLADRGECVHVRGNVLPVYRLKQIFAQQDGLDDLAQGILIVVEADAQRSCLFVDEILGQQQVVIKSLGMPRDRVAGLSGGAIMTDGRVALIVDVGTLVDSALGNRGD
ncbi:MAG: chemotaxis protein CheA [Planctomycetes bacterium]|nr:chemotaxis protein CheA [Planctomycetota bacterium]